MTSEQAAYEKGYRDAERAALNIMRTASAGIRNILWLSDVSVDVREDISKILDAMHMVKE